MIYYVEVPPNNSHEALRSYLRVQNGVNPAVARLLLTTPQQEYIMREISNRLILASMANPDLCKHYNCDEVYYTLGHPEFEAHFGTYWILVTLYVLPR